MSIEISDLLPTISGAASLGVEQVGLDGFTTDIRPFAHMHMNSGIWHGLYGQSGVIRFDFDTPNGNNDSLIFPLNDAFEFSVDGGLTYSIRLGRARPNFLFSPQGQAVLEPVGSIPLMIRGSGINIVSIGNTQYTTFNGGNFDAVIAGRINETAEDEISLVSNATNIDPIGIQLDANFNNIELTAGTIGNSNSFGKGQISLIPWGGSGQLVFRFGPHQGWAVKLTHSSLGGPANDGFWPLPHSGQINQLLTSSLLPANSGAASLGVIQNSLHGLSTTIRPYTHIHQNSGVFHDPILGQSGVIRYAQGNFSTIPFGVLPPGGKMNAFEISVDGGNTFPLRLGAAPTNGFTASSIPLGGTQFSLIDSIQPLIIRNSGLFALSEGTIQFTTIPNDIINSLLTPNIKFDSAGIIGATASGNVVLTTNNDIVLQTISVGTGAGGQIFLNAFANSGQLQYRFGPYEAWHTKPSHTSSFFPIAHSGQVREMILSEATLQTAYDAGSNINLENNSNLVIKSRDTGGGGKLLLTNDGTQGYLNLSGVFRPFTTNAGLGDVHMSAHGGGLYAQNDANDTETVAAKSLGPGWPVFNTGSGLVNAVMGSGMAQYLNAESLVLTTAFQRLPWGPALTPGYQAQDSNYIMEGSGVGIRIMSPGLYFVSYKVNAEKTVGTTPQGAKSRMLLNNGLVLGSVLDTFHYTTGSENSASINFYLNMNANDLLDIQCRSSAAGTENCTVGLRNALFCIHKVGPKRTSEFP